MSVSEPSGPLVFFSYLSVNIGSFRSISGVRFHPLIQYRAKYFSSFICIFHLIIHELQAFARLIKKTFNYSLIL